MVRPSIEILTAKGRATKGCSKFGGNPVDYLDGTVDQVHLFDVESGSALR